MNNKTRLLLLAALFVLALPLIFTGTASAKYMRDGSVPAAAGGFVTPTDGICVVGLHADGTMDVADGITSKRDCIYLNNGTMNGGTAFDLTIVTGVCTSTATASDGIKHAAASAGCFDASNHGISLKGLDRTTQMCTAKGGTWKTPPGCLAYGWQYRGQDAAGAPLAFGTKGTDASLNAGFCYAPMRTNIAVASCPSTSTNSSTAFGYSVSGTFCVYAYGVNGPVNAAMTKADGTSYAAAGDSKDLTTLTTQGDCLASGGSWNNWGMTKPSAGFTTANGITAAIFDLTRQAINADDGCLHCHSSKDQANGPAERQKDSFLKTGHKNMLRKVVVGNLLTGPDGLAYTTDGTNAINMAAGTINVAGVDHTLRYIYGDWMAALPSVAYDTGATYGCGACHTEGFKDSTNPGVQSIGTPGYTPAQPADSGAPFVAAVTAGHMWDNEGISCGRCHNATVPSVSAAQIAASTFTTTAPTGGGMGALAAGVGRNNLCFGCHQSIAKAWPSNTTQYDPTLIPVGVSHGAAPGRDFNGHVLGGSFLNSVHAKYAGVNSNSANGGIKLNALGKYDLFDAQPTSANTASEYGSTFQGYTCWQSPSSSSPAKTADATGAEIKDKATCETLYGAGSWRNDTSVSTAGQAGYQGTCTTCHDIHNSLFVASQEEAAIRKTCDDCHVNNSTVGATVATAPQVDGSSIRYHASGTPGTPFDKTKYASACEVCHMATQAEANGDQNSMPVHVWRINTSASYNTFPSVGQFYGGTCSVHAGTLVAAATSFVPAIYQSDTTSALCASNSGTWTAVTQDRNAQTAADGTYTKAVWVDLDLACGQCHGGSGGSGATHNGAPYLDKIQLSAAATNIHAGGGTCSANFFWTPDGTTSNKVNFDGSTSVCDGSCTYSWAFGDTGTGSGATTSHTYAGATPQSVTLTITSATCTASTTQMVIPTSVNVAPTVARTVSVANMTVTVVDSSTDDNPLPAGAVTVWWGDGTSSTGNAGGTFTHTYTSNATYILKHYVMDAGGMLARWKNTDGSDLKVVVPSSTTKYTITVNVGAAGDGATVAVKKNGVTMASGKTVAGSYTFINLNSGNYTVTATKFGYDWDSVAAGVQSLSTQAVTVGPSATVTFAPVALP